MLCRIELSTSWMGIKIWFIGVPVFPVLLPMLTCGATLWCYAIVLPCGATLCCYVILGCHPWGTNLWFYPVVLQCVAIVLYYFLLRGEVSKEYSKGPCTNALPICGINRVRSASNFRICGINRIRFASIFLRCRISRVRLASIFTSSGISRFVSLWYRKIEASFRLRFDIVAITSRDCLCVPGA